MTDWDGYDVPGLWEATRAEGSAAGWAQVAAWQTLAGHQATAVAALRTTRDHLAAAWPPSEDPVAGDLLRQLDDLIADTESLAIAAAANTEVLHRVVSELVGAKSDLDEAQSTWEQVTTDWDPEWWDGMAARLNERARERMAHSDAVVALHSRAFIACAHPAESLRADPPGHRPSAKPADPANPALPNAEPKEAPVDSTLPIPAGHPLAETGGVYHLPWQGREGWIQAGAPPEQRTRRSIRRSRRGRVDCEWEVASGVPTVIGTPGPLNAPRSL
ncbi:MAG: hypothetical protein HOV79_21820 [Hamadaea sp.]|nr:hypothetical protein [Hamadaea sp.]